MAAQPRPEPAWTPSCPGPRKDAPAVVPPVINARAPARNPRPTGIPQSIPRLSRHTTPRVTPPCPAGTTTRSPTGSPITYLRVVRNVLRAWRDRDRRRYLPLESPEHHGLQLIGLGL